MIRLLMASTILLAPGLASAATYSAVGDYNTGVFSYGSGGAGAAFVPLSLNVANNCDIGGPVAGFAFQNSSSPTYNLPAIGKNVTNATLSFYTNVLSTQQLFMQAGFGGPAIIRFTAPVASTY